MKNLITIIIAAIVLNISIGCSPAETNPKILDTSLEIHVGEWTKTVKEANFGYTVDSSWPLLKDWYLDDAQFSVKLSDIQAYYWDKHELVLTASASEKFQSQFASPKAILAFVVTANKKPIYGGVFLIRPSEMGISFPVIYTDRIDQKLRFTIRPVHTIFDDYQSIKDCGGIDDPSIKEILTQAGKIH